MEADRGMSIPSYAELRASLTAAAESLEHPTKEPITDRRGRAKPHKYGRVVYFDGGAVGMKYDGDLLIAEGADHQDSVLALAYRIGATSLNNGVVVQKVSAEEFRRRSTGA